MAVRFYLLPYGKYGGDPRWNVPKYVGRHVTAPEIGTFTTSLVNQGIEGECVIAVDTTTANHAALAAKTDVVQLPADLDGMLSAAQAANAAAKLEERNLPGDWINEGMTWRQVLRNVMRILLFFQFLHSRGFVDKLRDAGIGLATEFGAFPPAYQTRIQAAATERGYGTIPPTTTLRQILRRLFAEWWRGGVIRLGGETF